MSYLIDTNVLSELRRKKSNLHVREWAESTLMELMYISVLSLGEIRKWIESLAEMERKKVLRAWLEHDLPAQFKERILNIDEAVAERWGILQAQMKRPIPVIDSLLAATALHFDLCIVSRNVRDFNYPGLQIINPWEK